MLFWQTSWSNRQVHQNKIITLKVRYQDKFAFKYMMFSELQRKKHLKKSLQTIVAFLENPNFKVQLFWEGHKNLEFFSTCFDIYLINQLICQNNWKITAKFCGIVLSAKIDTTLLVGHFTAISGHFFANHTNIFQKLRFWRSFWGA